MFHDQFVAECDAAPAGARIGYYRGSLMRDRVWGPRFLEVEALARAVWQAMEEGKVMLVQRKVLGTYEYTAIKLPAPYKPVEWEGCYAPPTKKHVKPVAPRKQADPKAPAIAAKAA